MKKIIIVLATILIIVITSGLVFISLFGGNLLLDYLQRTIGVEFIYKGRVSGIDTFVFRNASVQDFKVKIPSANLIVACKKAELQFDFSEIISKRAIGVSSTFYKPKFESVSDTKEKKDASVMSFLPGVFSSITGEKNIASLERLYCDLVLFGDTARVRNIIISSSDFILNVKCDLQRNGIIKGDLRAYFSPALVQKLPQEALGMFKESPDPWKMFVISFNVNPKDKFYKIEGDRFRLTIGDEKK